MCACRYILWIIMYFVCYCDCANGLVEIKGLDLKRTDRTVNFGSVFYKYKYHDTEILNLTCSETTGRSSIVWTNIKSKKWEVNNASVKNLIITLTKDSVGSHLDCVSQERIEHGAVDYASVKFEELIYNRDDKRCEIKKSFTFNDDHHSIKWLGNENEKCLCRYIYSAKKSLKMECSKSLVEYERPLNISIERNGQLIISKQYNDTKMSLRETFNISPEDNGTWIACILTIASATPHNEQHVFNLTLQYVPRTTTNKSLLSRVRRRTYYSRNSEDLMYKLLFNDKESWCEPLEDTFHEVKDHTVKFESDYYINHAWCYLGDNLIAVNFTINISHLREVKINIGKLLVWNCTFLTNKDTTTKLPTYTYNNATYVLTICEFTIKIQPPDMTTQPSTSSSRRTSTITTTSTTSIKFPSTTIASTTKSSAAPTTFAPSVTEGKDNEPATEQDKVPDTKFGEFFRTPWFWAGVSGGLSLVMLIIMICLLKKRRRQEQEDKRAATDIAYDSLNSESREQFPPNLETTYSRPFDNTEESPYACSSNYNENSYSVPYVRQDLEKLYAKPVPKSQRKPVTQKELYTKPVPKNKQLDAEVAHYRNVNKEKDIKSPVHYSTPFANNYDNVFRNDPYANTHPIRNDYAEPAYCELGIGKK